MIVQDGSSPGQRGPDHLGREGEGDSRREGMGSPAVIVVGNVVALREVLGDLR
jgi:siroheme synthase